MEKDKLPLITVAVPVYNAEEHLRVCLDSIIDQTYENLEILLVNDGSTDSSAKIIEEYLRNDSRIRIFHKKNEGIGAARNTLLGLFTGEYVTFIDNDDWIEKDHISSLYEQLIKHKSDISVCNFVTYEEEDRNFMFSASHDEYREEEYTAEQWFINQYDVIDKMSQCFTVPWGKLYKSSLLKDIAFPEDEPVEDDYTTYMIYLKSTKISYAHRHTYIHRKRGQSVTRTVDFTSVFPLKSIEERITLLAFLGHDLKDELDAYYTRLKVHQTIYLKKGDIVNYKRASVKLALIKDNDAEI